MSVVATALFYLCLGLFGSYLLVAEFLDTIGRLEIIEKRWPRIWGVLSNRPMRLILIVLLVVLLSKDLSEHLNERGDIGLKVTTPGIPTPTITVLPPPDKATVSPHSGGRNPDRAGKGEQPKIAAAPDHDQPLVADVRIAEQKRILSTNRRLPYGLEVVIQTDEVISPVAFRYTFSGAVGYVSAIPGGVITQYQEGFPIADGFPNGKPDTFVSEWQQPVFSPDRPIVLTVFSLEPVKLLNVEKIAYVFPMEPPPKQGLPEQQ